VPLLKETAAELSGSGANIRRERTARNLTQEKLAEKANLNIRTLQKIEAGKLNLAYHDSDPSSARVEVFVGTFASHWLGVLAA
jgi:transcriptional regulator with XRE-family HTH domain